MRIVRLDIAYDGTEFRGYARQPGQRTVQQVLEEVLTQVLGFEPDTSVAGRTDAGVHARRQVVSFPAGEVETDRLQRSLNSMLGGEIVVNECSLAAPGFNARFSATGRVYRYLASNASLPDPQRRGFVWFFGSEVSFDLLNSTAERFVGEIDFTSFCRSVPGKSNVRRVERSVWDMGDGDLLTYWVEANSFCHQMVRSLVGTCYDVARGYTKLEYVSKVIERADRSTMGTVAPPHGLTLWDVSYDV